MAFGDGDASYQAAGGEKGIRQLVVEFYHQMSILPEAKKIRDMHPSDLDESIDKLTRFLSGWLGGPALYAEKYGSIRIPQAHAHLSVGEEERDAWLLCMQYALAKQAYSEDFKAYMLRELYVPAERIRVVSAQSKL